MFAAKKKACVRGAERKCRVNRKLVCADATTVCDTELRAAKERARGCDEWVRIFEWMSDVMNNGGYGYAVPANTPANVQGAVLAVKLRPLAMARIAAVPNPDPVTVARATQEQAALMPRRLDAWVLALTYYLRTFASPADKKRLRDETLPEAMRLAKLETAAGQPADRARAPNAKLTRRAVMQRCPAETRACHKLLCTDRNLPCAKEVTEFLHRARKLLPMLKALEFCRVVFPPPAVLDTLPMVHAVKLIMPRVKQQPAETRGDRARVLLATPAAQRDLAAIEYVYAAAADKDAALQRLKRAIIALRDYQKQRRRQ